jgi:hypothetical protein
MATIAMAQNADFHSVLAAPGRAGEIPEAADAYGWLAGSWELEATVYPPGGGEWHGKGEAHFGWVLEGRSVQDVWILPQRAERGSSLKNVPNLYGATIRVWDASIQAWRVTWINPVSGARDELIGRWSGKDVVQVGRHADGTAIRWIFSEITPESFHWTGEALNADGKTWRMEGEFRARRVK